jgi:adenylate cyclase
VITGSDTVQTQVLNASYPLRVAGWHVDPTSNQIQRSNEVVKLEPKAMEVLLYLAARPGVVVTREELEAAVWAPAIVGYDAVTTTMLKLRKAFSDNPKNPQIIETIPKRGYRLVATVNVGHETTPSRERQTGTPPLTGQRWLKHGIALIVLSLIAVGTALWFGSWYGSNPQAGRDRLASIAVLPFSDLGKNPDQAYFADGITDDLITDLTKISGLFVISRDSSSIYKNNSVDISEIARELGVRYLLHGSIRRVENQVRINAQLTDATTGNQLWAERYDGDAKHIFELQDRITQQIVSSLAVKLTDAERRRIARKDTKNTAAYEHFLQGSEQFFLYSKNSNKEARASFIQAVKLDSNFARAYAMLGWTHVFDFMNGWSDVPAESLVKSEQYATQALALNDALPVAYFVRGLTYREQGEYVKALVEAEKAIALDPSYANGYVLYATLLYYAGRPKEGLAGMHKAIRLNPHHPHNYPFHLGQAYFVLKRYPEAIAAFKQGLESNPSSERLRVWLAAAYAQAGDIKKARWEMDQVLFVNPAVSVSRFQKAFPFKDPSDLENFLDGLRKAGLS